MLQSTLTAYLVSLQNIIFSDRRRAFYFILLICMIDWNSLVYVSSLYDISSFSFWKTERLPRKHIQIDFINENAAFSSDPCYCYIVGGFSRLFFFHFCKAWKTFLGLTAHSSCHRYYQRCETSMINLRLLYVFFFSFSLIS